jgi:hypothetical protein
MPLVAYGLGLLALMFLFHPSALADRTTSTVLGLMWLWTGVAYHWLHFAGINLAAYLFGAAIVMRAPVLLYAGWTRQLAFGRVSGGQGAAGLAQRLSPPQFRSRAESGPRLYAAVLQPTHFIAEFGG